MSRCLLRIVDRLPGRVAGWAALLIILASVPAQGAPIDLRYSFRPGSLFETTVSVKASGEISSSSGTLPVLFEGTVIRRYRVAERDPGRLYLLEPSLDSATFRIASGSLDYEISMTPGIVAVDGVIAWATGSSRPPLTYIPFLDPTPFRIDSLGRIPSTLETRREIPMEPGAVKSDAQYLSSTVSSLFLGDRMVFPLLPADSVEPGDTWAFRGGLGRLGDGSAGLIRTATMALLPRETVDETRVRIGVVEKISAGNEPALRVVDRLQPLQPPGAKSAPRPRVQENESVTFDNLTRDMKGAWTFDDTGGRPLFFDGTGSLRLEATDLRHYIGLEDAIPLTYSLDLDLRIRFDYPPDNAE